MDELATELGLAQYAVLGYSSGGPHALASAALNLGSKVVACGLLSSDAPYAAMSRRGSDAAEGGAGGTEDMDMVQRLYGVPRGKVTLECVPCYHGHLPTSSPSLVDIT